MTEQADFDSVAEPVDYSQKPVYECIKRASDVSCSALALVLLSPILLLTMFAIYIDDPGPVLFKQVRIGQYGREFTILKFRSMRTDAEEMKNTLLTMNQDQGANFKIDHDPRVTRVGRLIRKTSIDELPQLLNILRGDMSIIGPRPFIESEQKCLPADRLLVKPGLSCYWQIGGKNQLTMHEQIELDRRYIRERSLFVDVRIIVKTMKYVLGAWNE